MMAPSATPLPYLEGYSPAVQARVRELLAQGQLEFDLRLYLTHREARAGVVSAAEG